MAPEHQPHPASPRLMIAQYLHRERKHGQLSERSELMAPQIAAQTNPLHEAVVATIVGAHQEADTIYQGLAACQSQAHSASGLSIVLGLNWPEDADKSGVPRTIDAIKQAQTDFPNLDIRLIDQGEYPADSTIARIKKDLWDAIALAHHRYNITEDLLVFNFDADLIKLSPHAIDRAFETYVQQKKPRPLAMRLLHKHEPGLPYFNKLLTLHDARTFFLNLVYSGALAFPLSFYCKAGGTNPNLEIGEMLDICLLPEQQYTYVPGTLVTVSGRRALWAFAQGDCDPWTEGFSLTERYREKAPKEDVDPYIADMVQWRLIGEYDESVAKYFSDHLQLGTPDLEAKSRRLCRLTALCGLRLNIPELNGSRIYAHYVNAVAHHNTAQNSASD